MSGSTNKLELAGLFPLAYECIETTGIRDRIILKFKTFYLKIYDDEHSDSYIVKGYPYNSQKPIFEDKVPVNQIRNYASWFRTEGLRSYMCNGNMSKNITM